MRFRLVVAALCALTAAYAPAPKASSVTGNAAAVVAEPLPTLGEMMLAQSDGNPEDTGACVHRVSSMAMCNDITRRYCFSAMFASAVFYEGISCSEAKANGYY